jgi:PmbA protein
MTAPPLPGIAAPPETELAELTGIADSVLEAVGHDGAEVVVTALDEAVTRYARNQIHQNGIEGSRRLRLRVVGEDRVGVAELRGDLSTAAERVASAAEAARRMAPAGEVTPLPKPDAGPDGPVAYSRITAECTPEARGAAVEAICQASARAGFEAFGTVRTSTTRTVVISTTGMCRRAESTTASVVCVARGEGGWGYADGHHHDVTRLDARSIALEAVETCARNQGAATLEPGTRPVVLSPYAVAELLAHLADLGFSALARQQGRSFMRPGERMMSEGVTVVDDAGDPESMPFPFDAEGVSTRGVTCVEAGVCRGFVHDSATALTDDAASTGHALPMPNPWGPQARHLSMSAGDQSLDDLLAACDGGLYVTRLWYVRDVHPLATLVTGMTRDGTFLIERGRLGRPVRDLRFTQGIVAALADVRGVGRHRRVELDEGERPLLVPHLALGAFTFTS